ncbi:general secretion pathway protein A [Methylocaldum marinum]|uniref:General secretion pathway protein A n=1 Tax=Methylocaldum marinum TaxID=1432792 RepID=A0A250KS70_9GAMM|nr:AAA family ATPase [Methylocaldum marinum]BBA34364.1 general secretion pathway protein A [Methylocaldum marinum]
MYTQFFSLSEPPFSATADPRYVYLAPQHDEVLARLLYDIDRTDGGLSVLTGEAGVGKTTLCRCLLEQLPDTIDVALILNPVPDGARFLASICDGLNVAYPSQCIDLDILVDLLGKHLTYAYARGRRAVVLIGKAQNLGFETMELIRLLTHLETHQIKLLRVILVGQPDLNKILAHADSRQIARRVTARYQLRPFCLAETRAYIQHRLTVGGCPTPLFTRLAMGQVHRRSGGIPRKINAICDRALLDAHRMGKTQVSRATARHAAREVLTPAVPGIAHGYGRRG